MYIGIIIQILLICCNAVFACAEIAVLSVSDARLSSLESSGDKKAKRLAKLKGQPARFLATIQVAITLSGFLGSAFAADNYSKYLTDAIVKLIPSLPVSVVQNISVILITVILSYITLVLGELVPKRIAMRNAEKVALGISAMISFISKIFFPIVWFLTVSTNAVLRLFGIDPNDEDEQVTEEEIRMMVDVGGENGSIAAEEQQMIQNIFEFDDITAGEIATHRTEISMLWEDESMEEWDKTITGSRFGNYPICGESVDNVIGVLSAKSYFRLKDKSRESVMENAVTPPYFVPESVTADVLFRNMKSRRSYFAIILDEYGGMNGIVTLTDLIECLLGDISEEEDTDEPQDTRDEEIEPIDSLTWRIGGAVPCDDAAKELGIEIPEEYETFGGYLFGMLGYIPDDGSQPELETDELQVKITEIREHRIITSLITLIEAPDDGEDDADEDDDEKSRDKAKDRSAKEKPKDKEQHDKDTREKDRSRDKPREKSRD